MTIFTVPAYGSGGGGGPGPPGPAGPVTVFLRYTSGTAVPDGGVRYLQLGPNVYSSEAGDLPTADFTIIGASIAVNVVDTVRAYNLEILTDPSGSGGTGPTVVGTLFLPLSTLRNRTRALSIPVAGLTDIGVRLSRTSGTGPSTFTDIAVLLEATIP